jgi:hypothetical protein
MSYTYTYTKALDPTSQPLAEVSSAIQAEIVEAVEKLFPHDDELAGFLDDYIEGWYDGFRFIEDFIGPLSLRFPSVLFHVDYEGEEKDDLTHYYVQNGQVQECPVELVYAPYNPDLLKPGNFGTLEDPDDEEEA